MPEVLVILEPAISDAARAAVTRTAAATQSVSDRVYIAVADEATLARMRSMAGVATIMSGGEHARTLPPLSDAESLFVQAWLSRQGEVKQRRGDGLDWDTPPMQPPDPKRQA